MTEADAVPPRTGKKTKSVLEAEIAEASEKVLTEEEVESCNILDLAKDKVKYRTLQNTLDKGSFEARKSLIKRSEKFINELASDPYGNFLSQKLVEVVDDDVFVQSFNEMKGRLVELSEDLQGTRVVQRVIEQGFARGMAEQIVSAFSPDDMEPLSLSITGVHVVLKLVELLPDDKVAPFVVKLCNCYRPLAEHQWGCCVLKKCIDRAEPEELQRVTSMIMSSVSDLVEDKYGNYVVQHLVDKNSQKPNPIMSQIIKAFRGKMLDMCLQKYSSNVLEICLDQSIDEERQQIINELLNESEFEASEIVRRIIFHEFGNYVFQKALEVSQDPEYSLLIEHAKLPIQEIIFRPSDVITPDAAEEATGDVQWPALPEGCLPLEQAKRLAGRFLKRYPAFSASLWESEYNQALAVAQAQAMYWEACREAEPPQETEEAQESNEHSAWDPSLVNLFPFYGYLPVDVDYYSQRQRGKGGRKSSLSAGGRKGEKGNKGAGKSKRYAGKAQGYDDSWDQGFAALAMPYWYMPVSSDFSWQSNQRVYGSLKSNRSRGPRKINQDQPSIEQKPDAAQASNPNSH